MGTHLLNVTGRKKIIYAKSENTEVKISAKSDNNGVNITVELKLNKKHKFPGHAIVTLYPYQKGGGALQPISLGTIEKLKNVSDILPLPGADIDNLLFRLKVSDKKYILGLADTIRLVDDEDEGEDTGLTTLFPIITDNIGTPFQIKMSPNSSKAPTLVINKKSKIKAKLVNDPYTMILVYSAAVREILTNFLINSEYSEDIWKERWIKFIHKSQGDPDKDYPEPYFTEGLEGSDINRDTIEWIDDAVSTISNLKLKDHDNKTLMEILIENAQSRAITGVAQDES